VKPSDQPFSHIIDGVHLLPVLHERIEYAALARAALDALQPDAVAVEIASSLETTWTRAIDRLPAISVVLYETGSGSTIYLPVQPGDAFVEAARWAREQNRPLRCVDLDVDGYSDHGDRVPDAYATLKVGAPLVYDAFCASKRPRDPLDDRREAAMAYHARELLAAGANTVLLLCGMHHAEGIARQLEREQAVPLTRPRRDNIRMVHLHPESLGEVLSEIPFYVAAYERRRAGLSQELEPASPSAPAATQYGPFRVLSGRGQDPHASLLRAVTRAARSLDEGEMPDRLRLQWALLNEAEQALTAVAPDEAIQPWQRTNLARYSRNLSLISGLLVPDLFCLLNAARGCVSENYAWELHRLATSYPDQAESATDLPTARIRAEEMFDGVRRIRIERRLRKPKRPDWKRLLGRPRRSERFPGEWLSGFDDASICSYPPEDIVIEDFGGYLRRRGKQVLSDERSKTVPFTTTIADGIDIRETLRHWQEGQIFVREAGRSPGEVGSVVAVFDEDESLYPHCQTWLGEHEQESDMAFFCTDPTQAIVGPGICRVSYGGFLLSYPPRRMADVWTDPDYAVAETRAEVLLLAAMDYCAEKVVVHIAARPPRTLLTQLARRLGLKIVHLPIGTISPTTIRRIRVMHILAGHDKRELARDYIW